jgi:hypothetical protein
MAEAEEVGMGTKRKSEWLFALGPHVASDITSGQIADHGTYEFPTSASSDFGSHRYLTSYI